MITLTHDEISEDKLKELIHFHPKTLQLTHDEILSIPNDMELGAYVRSLLTGEAVEQGSNQSSEVLHGELPVHYRDASGGENY